MSRRAEIHEAIPRERERLVRDLRTLPAGDWEKPSLCEGWRVRDVVAHLIRNEESYRRGYPLLVDLVRAGFRPQAALAKAARRRSEGKDPSELIESLARTRYEGGARFHPTPAVPLGELLIHGQDIRRALGVLHDIPPETFRLAAEGALTFTRYLFGWGRTPSGVRFEATDVDWAVGTGEIVRGPIEAITMVLAGRSSASSDLSDPGTETLAASS